jgi:hypothetical protein
MDLILWFLDNIGVMLEGPGGWIGIRCLGSTYIAETRTSPEAQGGQTLRLWPLVGVLVLLPERPRKGLIARSRDLMGSICKGLHGNY